MPQRVRHPYTKDPQRDPNSENYPNRVVSKAAATTGSTLGLGLRVSGNLESRVMTTSIGITSNDASYLTCGEIRSPESHWEEEGG